MKKPILFINLLFLIASTVTAQTTHTVLMTAGDTFDPATLTIDRGDIVTWQNNDTESHTSTSGTGCTPDNVWDSGTLTAGQTFSFTFNQAGTFPYYCTFHCALGMVGAITVNELDVTGTSSPYALHLDLKSFPNPFSDNAVIEFDLPGTGLVKMEVFDMMGQKVFETPEASMSSGRQSLKIISSDMMAGMYVCKIYYNGIPSGSKHIMKAPY